MTMERRHNVWYAYLTVPVDVREKIGKRRFYKSLETDRKDLATIRHMQHMAVWKEQIRVARLGIPDYLVKANAIAVSDTKYDPEEVKTILDAKGEDAAAQFVSIASGQDIVFEPNLKAFLDNLKCVPESLNQHDKDISYFCEHFTKLSEVSTKSIRKWITLQRQQKTDNAIKRHLRIAKKFFKYLEYKFNVVIDVDLTVPDFDKVESVKVNRTEISDADLLKIYDAAPPNTKDLIVLLAYTGARIDDLSHIRVNQIIVDPETKVQYIDIRRSKNKDGVRKQPVHRMLVDVISRLCKEKSPNDYLITRNVKDRAAELSGDFSKVKVALGFDGTISAHSIRHSVTSKLYRLGYSELDVCRALGHAYKGKSEGLRTYFHGKSLVDVQKVVNAIAWDNLATTYTLPFDDDE